MIEDFCRKVDAPHFDATIGCSGGICNSAFPAFSTKTDSECVAHVAQALTDMDDHSALLAVDGIDVFDIV